MLGNFDGQCTGETISEQADVIIHTGVGPPVIINWWSLRVPALSERIKCPTKTRCPANCSFHFPDEAGLLSLRNHVTAARMPAEFGYA